MAFQPEQFGKYYLIDKIAVGGMAEIFKAKQFGEGGFEKVLVIKRILSHLSEDDDFINMFRDEAKISSTLSHSNIIHIYDFGKIRNNYFIAMEYCEGKDLKTVMKKCQEIGRPLPVEYAVYIIHEALMGLDYAHRKKDGEQDLNILHRDISPSNIMISYDEGRCKIADFGIAKAETASYKTKAGVLKGKFEYMSPEQASGLPVDRRSDIFSVGICFYEILTRRRLFKTDSDLKTLELIRNPLIPPPSHLNPQVREELDAIVMKALARNPDDRYQEAWQMQHDLREFMRSSSPPTSPDLIALSLAVFMREIFDREIRQERERLEIGTRCARQLMLDSEELEEVLGIEENWEIPSGGSRVSNGTNSLEGTAVRLMIEEKERRESNRPMIAGVLVAILVIIGGLAFQSIKRGDEARGGSSLSSSAHELGSGWKADREKSFATLVLEAQPVGARVFLDGALIGTMTDRPLRFKRMPTEEQVSLRVEKDGFIAYEKPLLAQPGGMIDVAVALQPERSDVARPTVPVRALPIRVEPQPTPVPPAREVAEVPARPDVVAGKLEFYSNPSGAKVFVGGDFLCYAPCGMQNGQAGQSYDVEMRLTGYQPYSTRHIFPSSGVSKVSGTLPPLAMGELTLTIKDGLSAEIFVDEEEQPRGFAPFWKKMPLPAGKRKIRLRNQVAGLERVFNVEIVPGRETKLTSVDLTESGD